MDERNKFRPKLRKLPDADDIALESPNFRHPAMEELRNRNWQLVNVSIRPARRGRIAQDLEGHHESPMRVSQAMRDFEARGFQPTLPKFPPLERRS
jgi:hypothetical protein